MQQLQPQEFQQGCADAERDISAGKPRLFWGTRGAWGTFFEDLFRTRYGVIVEHTDSFVWPALKDYREGYNSTVIAYIDRTHGSGTFDRARAEVESFRRESYAQNIKSVDDDTVA